MRGEERTQSSPIFQRRDLVAVALSSIEHGREKDIITAHSPAREEKRTSSASFVYWRGERRRVERIDTLLHSL